MELATGTQVGPYEIQRKLGAGGMGVVYRALDSRLGRQVAIKVLPEAMRHDTDRMRRFEREARTIGALNHPNLVTLHDVGTHDGTPFLVTELLDGMSLRQRLDEGRLEPREAVRIAGEIARGLAAAHGAGVTHRDIKPENIFVIGDDRVKVLDFGIAKLAQKDDDDATAKTMEGIGIGGAGPAHTGTGMVVGTPGYMAPEQLGGADVDARTDIFALGVVLYEMLAGRRPFASESGIEESYAILKQTPRDLPTNVPAAIARVVRRCLEKKPAARFQSASDLAFALEATEGASNESDPAIRARDAVAETMTQAAITGEGTAETLAPSSSSGTTGPGSVVPTMPGVVSPIASIRARLGATPVPAARPATGVKERAITLVPPPRTRWPWALAAAVALAAGGVAIAVVRRPSAVRSSAWPELVDGGAAFRRVTFLSQPATYARFTKDEQSILWSERRNDNWYVLQSGVSAPSMTTTTLTGRVLDVARTGTGDVAIRTFGDGEGGTLKRGNPGMGAPEFVAVHVEDASFSADGKSFAIIRALDDATYALEYPIDKPIYRPTTGRLEAVRVSRGGAYLAVVETDAPPQTSGRLLILKPDGTVVARSTTYDGIDGVAWSPSDGEVWFAEGSRLRALDLAGGDRVLHRSALRLRLRDVARDGRILVAPTTLRARTLLGSPAQNKWKNVGWFDGSEVQGISRDGSTIVYVESTAPVHDESGYPTFRRVGEEPPISLGRARNLALFPDGNAVLMVTTPTSPLRITAEGKPNVALPLGAIERLDVGDRPAIAWSGRYVVVRAAAKGQPMRLWRYDLEAKTPPEPVGPDKTGEGTHPITADGAVLAIADRGKGIQLVSLTGAPTRVIGSGEIVPLSFNETGTSLFVMALHNYPRRLVEIELATGRETELAVIAPEDKPDRFTVAIDATGATLAYSTISETAELFIIEPPMKLQ